MDCDFFLLLTFLMRTEGNEKEMHIRCLGSREILKLNREISKNILGMIEFGSSYIPLVDIGVAFGVEPIRVDDSKCILIVGHNYKSQKLHTGIIIQDCKEIEKLAAGIYKLGKGLNASVNMSFVLEMYNGNNVDEILVESHILLSLIKEPNTEINLEYSSLQFGNSYNFMNYLEAMDLPQRQIIFEELANKPELCDKESNLIFL